jgi:signal transduction histidine kinase/CheY-like chemotaxis protein
MTRVDPGPAVNLRELRSQLASRVAALPIIGAAWLAVWLSARRQAIGPEAFAPFVALLALGGGVWLLLRVHPNLAHHLLVWGLTLLLLAFMWAWPAPWLPFIGLSLVFIGGMVVTGGALITAVLVGVAAVWLAGHAGRAYPLNELLIALALAAILAWLVVRTLYTALEWAWTMQRRADQLLELARDRQGELAQTLKVLDNANIILRRTERELIAARRQAEEARVLKEQFAANVSHEFRTPLNLILGFSEVMSLSPEVYGHLDWPPTLRQDINQVYRSARHLRDMIDDVLDLSRLEIAGFALDKQATAMSAMLQETVEIAENLFHGRPIRLETAIPANLPALDIDRIRIRQVLLNLLTNAARFTEQGVVRVAAKLDETMLTVSVSDTGPGISPDKLPYVFDEFYQVDLSMSRKHGGAGLGLAISQRFVEAHEGRIWVESTAGEGSTFSFALPLPGRQIMSAFLPTDHDWEPVAVEMRPPVLVVDPDPTVAAMIERHMGRYRVIQVADPARLNQEVLTHHPHVVIYNVAPGEHADRASALPASVPLIECSLPSQAWVASDLNVAACLNKPITQERLLAEVGKLGTDIHRVLVVDDDRGFCLLVERMLQSSGGGFAVSRAYGGEEGLAQMRAAPPDLLLLDLIMPDTDGFQVLRAARAELPLAAIPIILLTATSLAEDVLTQRRGHLVVQRPEGLRPAEAMRCLEAIAAVLEPRYDERALAEGVGD